MSDKIETHEIFGETVSVCEECNALVGGEHQLCNECKEQTGATENAKLEELIEAWTESAVYAKEHGLISEHDGIMSCADELKEAIDE